jgi:hypothetical protein
MDEKAALLRLRQLHGELKTLLADLAAPPAAAAPPDAWTTALTAREGAPVDHTDVLDPARAFRQQLGRSR